MKELPFSLNIMVLFCLTLWKSVLFNRLKAFLNCNYKPNSDFVKQSLDVNSPAYAVKENKHPGSTVWNLQEVLFFSF